jgi:DNA-binding NarL/FixJ family response regulator
MTRILVIDDSDTLRRSVRAVLGESFPGVTIGEAAGAKAGLALAAGEPWDAVLLDLSLPDRSGVETLRELRRLRPALPVVVMSLHSEAEYGDAVRAAGAAGYVAKGAVGPEIAAAVRGALRAPAAAAVATEPLQAGVAAELVAALLVAPELDREEERRRLARTLHDEIGQALVAAKIDLRLAETAPSPAETRRLVDEATGLLDEAIGALRDLSVRLRPALLDELGLLAATRVLLGRVETTAGVPIALAGADELPRAAPGDEIAAYRAVEGLLALRLRGSSAPAVLSLRLAGGRLAIALGADAAVEVPYAARAEAR